MGPLCALGRLPLPRGEAGEGIPEHVRRPADQVLRAFGGRRLLVQAEGGLGAVVRGAGAAGGEEGPGEEGGKVKKKKQEQAMFKDRRH